MKAEIEARIAALETELAAEKAKLADFISNVPQELHDLSQEGWDRLKAFFAKS